MIEKFHSRLIYFNNQRRSDFSKNAPYQNGQLGNNQNKIFEQFNSSKF